MTPSTKALATLALGATSTAVAIAIVWAIGRYADIEVLGLNLFYIVPVGAIGAGYCASYGFREGVLKLEPKIGIAHKAIILLILLMGFFAFDLIHYRESNLRLLEMLAQEGLSIERAKTILPGFGDWMQARYEGMTYDGVQLGVAGYALGALELAGFLGAGTFGLFYGVTNAFCDACQKRMTIENLFVVPGGESESEDEDEDVKVHVDAFLHAVKVESSEELHEAVEALTVLSEEREFVGDVTFTIDHVRCPTCWSGELAAKRNRKATKVTSETIGSATVSASFAADLRESLRS